MLVLLYTRLFLPLLLLAALAAWRWGGRAERAGAAAFVAAMFASALLRSRGATKYVQLEPGLLGVDLALLGFLTWLAIRSRRGWLIWASAFQLLSTTAHFVRLADSHFRGLAYGIMEGASSYPTVIALTIGILQHWRQSATAAGGSWRTS